MNQQGLIPIIFLISVLVISSIGVAGALYLNTTVPNITFSDKDDQEFTFSPSPNPTFPQSTLKPLSAFEILLNRFKNNKASSSPSPSVSPSVSPTSTVVSKPTTTSTPKPSPPKPSLSLTPTALSIEPACEITVKNSSSGWAPLWVQFYGKDNSPTGNPDNQKWDFDDDGKWDIDSNNGDTNVSNVYKEIGTYNAKLQLHSSIGESNCSTIITVKPASVECGINALSTSTPLQMNLSYSASFHGVVGDDYVTNVQWDYTGDGNWDTPFDTSSQNVTYTYPQTGNYTVKMHFESKNGLKSECTKSITVN